jgi:predicted RNase H-like nuclease
MTPCLVGVDGCRGGWVAVVAIGADLKAMVYTHWSALVSDIPPDSTIAVDIPIGLPTRGARVCDLDARRVLGRPRASSVFPAPIRAVLSCIGSHAELSALHRRIDGRGLTKQAFHILPKIREVDLWLNENREEEGRVWEIHPEVSFTAWNNGRPMLHHKCTTEGRAERECLIHALWPTERHRLWSGVARAGCGQDDLNDAIAALWTAGRVLTANHVRIPDHCHEDEAGRRMQIAA